MKIQLIRYQNEFYLNNGEKIIKHLDTRELRLFLKHYNDEAYYITDESASIVQPDSSRHYDLMAYVDDKLQLCICNPELMQIAFSFSTPPYISTDEFAEKYNRKKSIVMRLCREGRIEGAAQINSVWIIPEDAQYPSDARYGARVPSSRVLAQQKSTRSKA